MSFITIHNTFTICDILHIIHNSSSCIHVRNESIVLCPIFINVKRIRENCPLYWYICKFFTSLSFFCTPCHANYNDDDDKEQKEADPQPKESDVFWGKGKEFIIRTHVHERLRRRCRSEYIPDNETKYGEHLHCVP